MNYNYDDERQGVPPGTDPPDSGVQDVAGEDILPEASGIPGFYTPNTAYGEAPVEDMDEDTAELTPEAPLDGADNSEPDAPQPWSDPAYSAVPEHNQNIYSPGISQPLYRAARGPEHHEHSHDEGSITESAGKQRGGGFMRAVCLVVVCALASAAATFGVLEYKLSDTDSTPSQQSQSAGNTDNRSDDGYVTPKQDDTAGQGELTPTPGVVTQPMINTGLTLSAQDIYNMACRQVVVVKTNVASQGGYFSQGGSSVISGSGFIIREDGYIVTNYHVVETAYTNNSAELTVTLNDGETYPAAIVGVEPGSDVAVIKIDATGLDPVTVGDSSAMSVGETIYAVGNPLGELVYTITDGIISALDREITVENTMMNMFQISAAVNSGNSGGPVYDTLGHVIGVVTAKFNNSTVEGIGFAIPINDVMRIAGQLMENGYIFDSKAYLGITVLDVDSATADFYDWVVGAYVRSVEPGSCAEKAGLKTGDIITKVGSINVTSQASLIYAKKCFNAGDTTELTVFRAGDYVTLTITFDTEPEAETSAEVEIPGIGEQVVPVPTP